MAKKFDGSKNRQHRGRPRVDRHIQELVVRAAQENKSWGFTIVLFLIHLASRRVHIAGITPHPNEPWMIQVARNATMADVGFLSSGRYLIRPGLQVLRFVPSHH